MTAALPVLYDIHGNTGALDSVLREADAMRVDRYVLGGDFGELAARWNPQGRRLGERRFH